MVSPSRTEMQSLTVITEEDQSQMVAPTLAPTPIPEETEPDFVSPSLIYH